MIAFGRPPYSVVLVMQIVMIFMTNSTDSYNEEEIWLFTKKNILSSNTIMKTLLNYDRENIDLKIIEKVKELMEHEKMQDVSIEKCSYAAF